MLTLESAVILIAASVCGALALLFVLRRHWTTANMRKANDATAFYITVAGTIYAVILAFMLTSVWEEFQSAKANTEREANALVNIFRLAGAFPEGSRHDIQQATREYARAMIEAEWPEMEHEKTSPRGADDIERLWRAVRQVEATGPSAQALLQQTLGELSRMTEHRRIRQLQSRFRLPVILWLVLIFGGVVTVANSCLLGVEDARLHSLYIVSLASLVALILVAIAEINRPFQGLVRVGPESFEMALATINNDGGH